MKKFREFLKEKSGNTNGDIIRMMVSTAVLLGCNLYACKRLQELELEKVNLLSQLESMNVQDEIKKIIDVTTESTVDLDF